MNGIPEAKMSEGVQSASPIISTETEKNEIPYGYCQCGCGNKTRMITHTSRKEGRIKGIMSRYITGHNGTTKQNIEMLKNISKKGKENHNWKGGITVDSYGYVLHHDPNNGRVGNYTREHVLIAEKILGKGLPEHAVIHHVDEDRRNNKNNNLVICENRGYHGLLHKRKRALEAGNVHMVRCPVCKKHDFPENMYVKENGQGRHRKCHAKNEAIRKQKRQSCLCQ